MITVKQQSKFMDRIKAMSELELASFLEELFEHLDKNKMMHLVIKDNSSEIRELQENADEFRKGKG
jgi:hypothetical protein